MTHSVEKGAPVRPEPGGPRLSWSQLPEPVHTWVTDILGAPVCEGASQRGGFSPGVADRVVTTAGRRAFVKACGAGTNPHSPDIHADEARILGLLPAGLSAPELFGWRDGDVDGERWVVLVTEDISGRHPHTPWVAEEVDAALAAYARAAGTPVPGGLDLPRLEDALSWEATLMGELAAAPPPGLDPWISANFERLVALTDNAAPALAGEAIVHMDARSDNLLVTTDGSVRIVDWPWACLGAPWFDTIALGLNARLYDPAADVEPHVRAAHTLGADGEEINTVLAVLLGYFHHGAEQPAPAGLPTLRAFQRAQGDALTAWLRERLEG